MIKPVCNDIRVAWCSRPQSTSVRKSLLRYRKPHQISRSLHRISGSGCEQRVLLFITVNPGRYPVLYIIIKKCGDASNTSIHNLSYNSGECIVVLVKNNPSRSSSNFDRYPISRSDRSRSRCRRPLLEHPKERYNATEGTIYPPSPTPRCSPTNAHYPANSP